ncbi:hypothetical protein TEA_018492 [Camellia sinensis var. sinensis]|uniref:Uncharacterized protein n=1 Tax=Camellia sinensis var. sinensis TaxID=542762 RepID=A0A4S4E5X6_CAMSN|nr:hypothetical protein TEA_018492 [Camellia sinensis var. sinensis]
MKQSTSSSLWSLFGEDEIEVAEILVNLPNLIFKSESRLRFASGWGVKRRRSAIDSNPLPLPQLGFVCHLVSKSCFDVFKVSPVLEERGVVGDYREINSAQRIVERGKYEIETVKSYYNKLKTLNLELKAKKRKAPDWAMSTILVQLQTSIPDLNVVASVEETFGTDSSQPLDHNRAVTDDRAKAAEARKRRMVRIKEMKSAVAAIKPPR